MRPPTAAEWRAVLRRCGCVARELDLWPEVLAEEVRADTFSAGLADVAEFLPEVLHESAKLRVLEESLNYSVQGLLTTFEGRITPEQAQACGRIAGCQSADQRAVANTIYGGPWGAANLGNIVSTSDGWTYRGRGIIQITGRANYKRVGELIGQDLVAVPDLLTQPRWALRACIAWWEDRIPDSMLGETTSIRRRVNGGVLGLREVLVLKAKVGEALRALPA